ncbi:uncharacterized protein LOC103708737 isoform X2 [Phoenix dactylifera]|uniref:Uncharacterized protein LOC103708737 isoform X2 n=1 Tax=Phoenix dactylifera TaxID=42345 RepID=A0A8B7C5B3_PHODC|nr:uncharacterized protein LOC103708737 isoform X2 [Phoenix dactylifera]
MGGREEAKEERSGGGGAGGKLARRSFLRRVQPTPYDRPPRIASAASGEEGRDGWLSRLLIRRASRLLPSLFSSSPWPQDSPASPEEEQEGFDGVSTIISDNQFEESKVPDASVESEYPFPGPEAGKVLENRVPNARDLNGLAEIEQRLKQKMFSRDETNRLIELLKSRTTEFPNDDGHSGGFIAKATEGASGPQDLITSGEHALQSDYQMTPKIFYSHHSKAKRVLNDGFTSVGPLHQIHQKNVPTACKGPGPSGFATSFSLPSGPSEKGASKGTVLEFHCAKANDESCRYMVGSSTVHPQSSAAARKILRRLERTVPPPQEKSLHLKKLDIAGMKVPSMPYTPVMGGQGDRFNASVSDDQKLGSLFGRNTGEQDYVDAQKVLPGLYMSKIHEDKLLSCPSQSSEQGNTTAGSEVFQIPGPVRHSSGFKPTLSSLFTTNPTSKSSDNGCSFAFPVSVTSNSSSEPPPTPTITKSQTVSRMSSNSEGSIPSFSFGSSTVDGGLVFSFGSIASSTLTETASPEFKFGSNENSRLSFKSLSRDAICY